MRFAVMVLSLLGCVGITFAGDMFYLGKWRAGGEASMSFFGYLTITPRYIAWEGASGEPPCRTAYTVVDRTYGRNPYPDEDWLSTENERGETFRTVKIKLTKAVCLDAVAYIRFAAKADNDSRFYMIRYNEMNQPTGWFGFSRQ